MTVKVDKIFKQIQAKILKLGPTNKARWTVFSNGGHVSPSRFYKRFKEFDIRLNKSDVNNIWKLVGVSTDHMTYEDFCKLIEYDVNVRERRMSMREMESSLDSSLDLRYEPQNTHLTNKPTTPLPKDVPIDVVLKQNRRAILMKCLERDPFTDGKLKINQLVDACQWLGVGTENELLGFLTDYVADDDGYIPYFLLLDTLCMSDLSKTRERSATYQEPVPTPVQMRVSFEQPSPPPVPIPSQDPFPSARTNSPPPPINESDISDPLDEYFSRLKSQPGRIRAPPEPIPEVKIENEVMVTPIRHRSPGRNLDPAIFGAKPLIKDLPPEPMHTADECVNAKVVEGLTIGQYIELISKSVFRNFKNAKTAYNKWRCSSDFITADLLRDGLARDANVVIPSEFACQICEQYGTKLSLSSFARMVSDGGRTQSAEGGAVTDDDLLISEIAKQISKRGWEDVIVKCQSADEIAKGLEDYGVKISSSLIHLLVSKGGKMGLIDSIHSRL